MEGSLPGPCLSPTYKLLMGFPRSPYLLRLRNQISLVSQKDLWLSQSQGQDSGIRGKYNMHVWRNPKESIHKLLSIDLKITSPFPTVPCGGCSLIPTYNSVQTHKAWREVGKAFPSSSSRALYPITHCAKGGTPAPSTFSILEWGTGKQSCWKNRHNKYIHLYSSSQHGI